MKRRKPNRLREYDYSNPAWYFVTICADKHANHFGDIRHEKIYLNDVGKIADKFWNEIPEHFPNAEIDEYIIMPNHIHGIIIINDVGDAKFASPTTDRTKMLLSKIVQQFKRAVTVEIKSKKLSEHFVWQRSFYDRIIRNERELFNIRKYIKQNPLKWEFEKGIENLEL
jgi:REP element-mobilizing transposase RayT